MTTPLTTQFPHAAILYVDDEEKSLKYFEASFDEIAPIYTATSPEEGLEIFAREHSKIGLILSDKKMPNMTGIEFLEKTREIDSSPLRILVTAFTDLQAAVDAFNSGLLYSYFSKPWDPEELESKLIRGLKFYSLIHERNQLLAEKSQTVNQLRMADRAASLGILSMGLNHHLRNAFMVMRMFHDLIPEQLRQELGREPSDKEFWEDNHREVSEQIDRISTMLGQLWEGSHDNDLMIESDLKLDEMMGLAAELALLDRGDEISFQMSLEGDIPVISGDQRQLSQMARLLLAEAASDHNQSSQIEVVLAPLPAEHSVKVQVVFDGNLIPEQDLANLFDPFFVRSDRPTDLSTGLMACYLTTFRHGGRIWAEHSGDGRNAMCFVLPIVPKQVSLDLVDLDSSAGKEHLPTQANDAVS